MRIAFSLLILALSGLFFVACSGGSSVKSDDTVLDVPKKNLIGSANLHLDTRFSVVEWTGKKVIGGRTHRGTIPLKSGALLVKDNELVGGDFTIDMAGLAVTDLSAEDGKQKLENHLKTGDFFEVETYPEASFEIATITPVDTIGGATHMIAGNLTIKDVKKGISFPVNIRMVDNSLLARTLPFDLNRTDWGVNYGSSIIGALKDNAIADEVRVSIKIRGSVEEVSEPALQ